MKKKILFTLLVLFTLINVNAKEEYTRKTTMNINNSGSVNFEIKYLNDYIDATSKITGKTKDSLHW